jgi:Tol biopolymer transport system component
VEFTKLPEPINTASDNTNPVLSGDGKTMIFISELAFYDAIHMSKWENGRWSEPEVLNPQVGSDGDMYPTSLSYDGKELYLVKRDDEDSDIYVSHLGNEFWSKAIPLGSNINTGTHETHASVSSDGNTLYFASARRGGFGELDIYRSKRLASGEWGEAGNLGPVINTDKNEDTPFLSDDGRQLFFSSEGHFNMGGYDVFFSRLRDNGQWRDPINIGFPINTTTDDLFFYPIGDGRQAYLSRIERVDQHAFNIYHLSIGERKTEFSEEPLFPDDFTLRLIHRETGDTILIQYLKESNSFKTSHPGYDLKHDPPER